MRPSQRAEKGAFLVILALTLLALLAVIALAIDTSIITTSRAHFRIAAELANLGALKSFGEGLSAGETVDEAMLRAQNAAQASLSQNFQQGNPGFSFQVNKGNVQNVLSLECTNPVGNNGCLRRILWYFPQEVGPACPADAIARPIDDPQWRPCPCNQSCECGEGCPLDPVVTGQPGNGLRLAYQTAPGSPLRGFFKSIVSRSQGGAVQNSDVGLSVVSRAVLVPRNAVFAIDFSESVAWMPSHTYSLPQYVSSAFPTGTSSCAGPVINKRRRFVYEVEPGAPCNPNGTTLLPPGVQNPYQLGYYPGGQEADYAYCVYQANAFTSAQGANGKANEYQCADFTPSNPIEYSDGTTEIRSFLLNTVVKPEPLTSILESVRRAMIEFQTRGVPGDRVGIVGFDQERIENRILAENAGDINTIRPSQLTNVQFLNFLDALDPAKLVNDPARVERFLFPRTRTSSNQEVNTDIPQFLNLARRMITNTPNYKQMQNFVVMFTDGMTNCRTTGSPRCNGGDEAFLNDSIDASLAELNQFVQDRIALHMVLFSENSIPHEIAWNIDGRCATGEEARARGWPTVDETGPFKVLGAPRVNRFFSKVAETGGLWAPIRECNRDASGKCVPFDGAAFNGACSKFDSNARAAALRSSLSPANQALFDAGVVRGGAALWGSSPFFDNRGRIRRDPLGREVSEQMRDYMNIILAKPPYVLTSPSCRLGNEAPESVPLCN